MLELYTAYTNFLDASHWSVAVLIYAAALVINMPLVSGFTKALMEGSNSFGIWLAAIGTIAVPLIYPCSMFSSWVTFGIWPAHSWQWFYVLMGAIWFVMQLGIWTVIKSGHFNSKDAS